MEKKHYYPNQRGWRPSENDFVLVFMPVNGFWREVAHDIPKYSDILLSDFLSIMNLQIPDYTQFLRIISDDMYLAYRHCDSQRITIRILYNK